MKRIVICLDGTWNNPYNLKEREDGRFVYKPSNPLKTARAVLPVASHDIPQITYYDAGVGGLNKHPGVSNGMLRWVDNKLGGAWGAGFESNIEDAYLFLAHNYVAGDEVYLFGFSRGAAQVRALARFMDWVGGIPKKADAYYIPVFYRNYLESRGEVSSFEVIKKINEKKPRDPIKTIIPVPIQFLGVWDTVMALGSRIKKSGQNTSTRERAFHVADSPAARVKVARQALAIDERRADFRPEIWKEPRSDSQSLKQAWFCGVHSNIGGGYQKDGLANEALHWMLDEASNLGLEFDDDFIGIYRPFSRHKLYESYSKRYKFFDGIRKRTGFRSLFLSEEAHSKIHPSVFSRLNADPEEKKTGGEDLKFPDLETIYRPENLLAYLATRPDVDDYLEGSALEAVQALR